MPAKTWSPLSEDALLTMIRMHGPKWAFIARVPTRTVLSLLQYASSNLCQNPIHPSLSHHTNVQIKDQAHQILFECMLSGHPIPRGLENINLRDRMQAVLNEKGIEIEGYPVETDEFADRKVEGWDARKREWERMELEAREREKKKREKAKKKKTGRTF